MCGVHEKKRKTELYNVLKFELIISKIEEMRANIKMKMGRSGPRGIHWLSTVEIYLKVYPSTFCTIITGTPNSCYSENNTK